MGSHNLLCFLKGTRFQPSVSIVTVIVEVISSMLYKNIGVYMNADHIAYIIYIHDYVYHIYIYYIFYYYMIMYLLFVYSYGGWGKTTDLSVFRKLPGKTGYINQQSRVNSQSCHPPKMYETHSGNM